MATHKNSAESIEKIANAARSLFAKKGYSSASLDEIATRAGFTKGAVYHFFRSKEALLLTLLRDIEYRSIAQTELAIAKMTGASAMDKLIAFNRYQARWAARNVEDLAILMLVSIETATVRSPVREQVTTIYARIEDLLLRVLREGVATGEFAADIAIPDAVTWIIAVHDGNMLLWYRSGRSREVGRRLAMAARQAMGMAVGIAYAAPMDPPRDY